MGKTLFQVQQHDKAANFSGLKRLKNSIGPVSTTALNTACSTTSTAVKTEFPSYYQQRSLPSLNQMPDAKPAAPVTGARHPQQANRMHHTKGQQSPAFRQATPAQSPASQHSTVHSKGTPVQSPTTLHTNVSPSLATKVSPSLATSPSAAAPVKKLKQKRQSLDKAFQIVGYEDFLDPPLSSDADIAAIIDWVADGGGEVWLPPEWGVECVLTDDADINKIIGTVGQGRRVCWCPFRKIYRTLPAQQLEESAEDDEEDEEEESEEEVR